MADAFDFTGERLEKFAVWRLLCISGNLGTGGVSDTAGRGRLGFDTMRLNLDGGVPRPTGTGIRF